MSRRARFVGMAVLLVCTAGVLGLATVSAGDVPAPSQAQQSGPELAAPPGDFAQTTFVITLYGNGSATWTTRYSKPLNETNRADFESYATEFNTSTLELYEQFTRVGQQLTADGENATGRPMDASNFQKAAYIREDAFTSGTQGVVDMSFRWSNFTEMDGPTVRLGDVFQGGIFIGPNQRIEIQAGPNLQFQTVEPTPSSIASPGALDESQWILWEGPQDFNDQRPFVELAPPTTPTTTTTGVTTTSDLTTTMTGVTTTQTAGAVTTTAPADTAGGDDGSVLVVGVILLLLVLGTLTVWWVVSDSEDDAGSAPAATDGTDGGATGDTPNSPVAAPTSESATPNNGASAQSSDVGSSSTPASPAESDQPVQPGQPDTEPATPDEQPAPAVSDEDLLSDTDRVQKLLKEHGGRMRQSAIVEETDWSKSKVSMLLSDMADEDEITKLRVGRENIISLPGHEPEAAGSPFEDED